MPNEQGKKKSGQKASSTGDGGAGQVQAQFDQDQAQGYHGEVADPTPNHAYTVAGVTGGEPTPETDEAAAKAAGERKADIESDLEGK